MRRETMVLGTEKIAGLEKAVTALQEKMHDIDAELNVLRNEVRDLKRLVEHQ